MFDPNMNQPYSFAGLVKIMLSFALLLLKNDGAKQYNKSAIPPGRRPLWHLRARGQNLKLWFDTLIDQIGGQTVFFEFSNNAGLTDIEKLGHISGGAALSLGSFEHLFFQSC